MNVQNIMKKYKLMKVRMKINFMAFVQMQSVQELFLTTILKTYLRNYKRKGFQMSVK